MAMRVYISGPCRNKPNRNEAAFSYAEQMLRNLGYDVFNPRKLPFTDTWTREQKDHVEFAIIDMCDAMYMLEGWEQADGAVHEHDYAVSAGKQFISE